MSTSAVAKKTDGDLTQSEEGLVCEDIADREEAQDEFDSDPGAPDLAALDPDGDGEVYEKEFGDLPGGTTTDGGQPGGSTVGVPPTGPRPLLRLLPLLGPRPFPNPAQSQRPTRTWANS